MRIPVTPPNRRARRTTLGEILFLLMILLPSFPLAAQSYREVIRCTSCQTFFSSSLLGKRCPRCLKGTIRTDDEQTSFRCARCGKSSAQRTVNGVCAKCRQELTSSSKEKDSKKQRRVVYRIRRRSAEPEEGEGNHASEDEAVADSAQESYPGSKQDRPGRVPQPTGTMERFDPANGFVCLNCRNVSESPRKGLNCPGCGMVISQSIGVPPNTRMPPPRDATAKPESDQDDGNEDGNEDGRRETGERFGKASDDGGHGSERGDQDDEGDQDDGGSGEEGEDGGDSLDEESFPEGGQEEGISPKVAMEMGQIIDKVRRQCAEDWPDDPVKQRVCEGLVLRALSGALNQ